MSGGGSEVTNTTPWSQAQPYLLDAMSKARGLFDTTSPQYANPASNFGFNQTTGALGGAINGTNAIGSLATSLNPGVNSAIASQLSGTPDYTAVKNALDAANTQTWDSFNNTEIPQLNQRASFLGNPSGAIKDLNWATSQIGKNMDLNAQQAYLGQYDNALARQAAAAGLGANIAQTAGQQSLQGAALYPTLAQMPQQNLADYASLISGTGGKFGSGSTSINPGAAGTAANIIGGLTAGTGLLKQLTGSTSVPGAVSKIGSLWGNDAFTLDPSITGDAGAQDASNIASSWVANNTEASDLAKADNQRWLDSLGNNTSDGGGSGGGVGSAAGIAASVAPKAYSLLAPSAPAAAAPVATTAAPVAADAVAPVAADAAPTATAPSGASSIGAAALPWAAAALATAAPIYGAFSAPFGLKASWWSDLQKNLNSSDPNTAAVARMTLAQQAVTDPQAQALAAQYGIQPLTPMTPEQASTLYGSGVLGRSGGLGRGYTMRG